MIFFSSIKNFIFLLLIISTVAGCTFLKKNLSKKKSSYQKIVLEWTKSVKIYEQIDTIIKIDALYKSWPVKKTYIDELSSISNFSKEERENLIKKEKKIEDNIYTFLLAVYTGEDIWNDFSKKNSIWEVALKDGVGNKLKPIWIRPVRHVDIKLKKFYPFITPWKKIYKVAFPKDQIEKKKKVTLVISSMLGRVELTWDK